ncbi:MAG: TPM domain-containing protein [Bacteroidales bacterium]|nr:TPM domain-containing protein [Bacteroidales bacterium]
MTPNHISKADLEDIKQAILNAELDTSGEIRVHIENKCRGDVLDRASYMFSKLKMQKTKRRNGVLFYLATESHQFAVIGDININKVTDEMFWENLKEIALEYFKEDKFADGLIDVIGRTGIELKRFFPYTAGDTNELSDTISTDNN